MPRFYIPFALISGHTIALPDASAHHAARVLRLALNDAIILFDGSGQEWDARICHIDKRTVEVSVGAARSVSRESSSSIRRETPSRRIPGIITRKRPGMLR